MKEHKGRSNLKMLRAVTLTIFFFAGFSALGQSPCPTQLTGNVSATESKDLLCLVPQLYGPGGLVGNKYGGPLDTSRNIGHEAHFQASSISDFRPINAEIGLQLSQVPLATPVAGFIIYLNGTPQETVGLGPVLADRAETIGTHALFLGANYQYFDFNKADSTNLRNFGAVFTHEFEACPNDGTPCILNGSGVSVPVYTQDVIATENRLDLLVNQFSFVGTFGVNSRWDISAAVPIVQVRMNMISNATIFNFEPPPVNHIFAAVPNIPSETYVSPSNAIFNKHESAQGLGDIRIRNKFVVWQGNDSRSTIASGLDARLPTGDAYNFLGSGTWGVRPFLIYSHYARVSTHVGTGFESNGQSVLGGDVTTQPVTKAQLPYVLSYNVGADMSFRRHQWLGLSADLLGNSLISSSRIEATSTKDYGGNIHPDIKPSIATVNEEAVSLGGKIKAKRLLLVGNCLIRVNDAGLHFKPSPLLGISYTF